MPLTPAELQRDALACAAAGAHAFHIHPRDALGQERLDARIVDAAANALHDAIRWPVSVSTGPWIEGDQRRRWIEVTRWNGPDSAAVDVGEEGAFELIRTLLGRGIEVEAGVHTVRQAEDLVRSGLCDRVHRVLVELTEVPPDDLTACATEMHRLFDRAALLAPRLQHGRDATAWAALEDAIRRGVDTRVGLEDVLVLPDGSPAPSNEALVRAAAQLGAA